MYVCVVVEANSFGILSVFARFLLGNRFFREAGEKNFFVSGAFEISKKIQKCTIFCIYTVMPTLAKARIMGVWSLSEGGGFA